MKGIVRMILATALILGSAVFSGAALFADEQAVYLSANDMEPAKIADNVKIDGFVIYAKSDKGVTVEAIDPGRVAADGEVFNARIKLNGAGAADYRSIGFTALTKQTVRIYLNSSSKTDARVLKFVDAEDGVVLAELSAPPDDGTNAGMVEVEIPKNGSYLVFSGGSGINIYMIYIE